LTAVGENYGSLMLSVDLTINTPTGNEEIHAVAKTVPPNEYIQKILMLRLREVFVLIILDLRLDKCVQLY
jgi:hypothetical protein